MKPNNEKFSPRGEMFVNLLNPTVNIINDILYAWASTTFF